MNISIQTNNDLELLLLKDYITTVLPILFKNNQSIQIKQLIKNYGFDHVKDNQNNNCLHYACSYDSIEITKFVINYKVDLNIQNYNGDTPLHLASNFNRLDVVNLLLENNANIYLKNNKGEFPFSQIINPMILQLFLDYKTDINLPNNYGDTLLHFACLLNKLDIVQLLISNNANINIQNNKGETPLHFACKSLSSSIVQLLLSFGANSTIINHDGKTAFDYVLSCQNSKIIDIFLTYKNYKELNESIPFLNNQQLIQKSKL